MKICKAVLTLVLTIANLAFASAASADTVEARCDVFPKGSDKASSSGLCSFSQRQGYISIQLKDGTRYELSPSGDKPGTYVDQNGKPAYRQSGLGNRGHIYRLAKQSLFIYWDPAPYNENKSDSKSETEAGSKGAKPSDSRGEKKSECKVNKKAESKPESKQH